MFDKALKSATNMLSRREHSVLELARKLENKDFPDEVIDRVINELINARLLSNERYAESYVRMRSGKGYGPARICLELKERGIDKLMVERTVAESEVEWHELAREVRERKFGANLPADFEQQAKQMRFLQYRGFSHAHINTILR